MIDYQIAQSSEEYKAAAALFREYAQVIGIDLAFQHFDEELKCLREMYGKPNGGIILAKENEIYVGCVAVRKITESIGELKRMYVRQGNQNKKIGKDLLGHALNLAAICNYSKLRLDTLNTMLSAIHLYKNAGFYEIPAYYANPIDTAVYFEKLW